MPMRTLNRNARLIWLVVLASVATVIPSSVDAQLSGQAHAQLRFARGRQLFVGHQYAQALEEFQAARSLVGSPNTQLYIARCLRGLGRNAEALVEFQRAVGEPPIARARSRGMQRHAMQRESKRPKCSVGSANSWSTWSPRLPVCAWCSTGRICRAAHGAFRPRSTRAA